MQISLLQTSVLILLYLITLTTRCALSNESKPSPTYFLCGDQFTSVWSSCCGHQCGVNGFKRNLGTLFKLLYGIFLLTVADAHNYMCNRMQPIDISSRPREETSQTFSYLVLHALSMRFHFCTFRSRSRFINDGNDLLCNCLVDVSTC